MIENRFYKVNEDGGTFVTADFYNPITKESKHEVVRDYDCSDGSRDNDELYYMPINEDVRRIWLHDRGIIQVDDLIEVVKGRTIPHGTIARVIDKKPYKDRYGRTQAIYIYLDNGKKINEDNCRLAEV